jgi:pilus assembly protein FimV
VRHTKKKILPFVFASGLLASSFAQAAQLGKLEVLSGAGEPFLAQIQVDLVLPEERASLQAKLASAEAFKAARLSMDPNLKNLKFTVQDGPQPGTALVKITSSQPLPAGFIDTLVELTWAGGRVAREYTLTIPAGVAKATEPAASLPEIRPPMTPPPLAPEAATTRKPPTAASSAAAPETPASAKPGTLNVQRGDTLSELAMQLVGDGVTLNQAMAAIYETNRDLFINGSVHLIREGAQIQVPNRSVLRARNSKEALLILAENDDRNVYSAYARQIGLLTVDKQVSTAGSSSTQGSITPQEQAPKAGAAVTADRLQIAPGAAQGASSADASAEELLAKNKALAEANERIALLEKNVSDLQRLLDMQKDLGSEQAVPSVTDTPAPIDTAEPAAVELPSETLSQDNSTAEPPALEAPLASEAPPAGAESVKTPADEPPFDWLPWVLAGAGGLAVLLVLLLIARARKNKAEKTEDEFAPESDSSFSEVNEFDEAIAAASTAIAAERASKLDKAENSDFDLDEVLNDRAKQADPAGLTQPIAATLDVKAEPEIPASVIPEFNEISDEVPPQQDAISNDEVTLDFPEDEVTEARTGSILDDLEDIEKGTLAAQEELEELRRQPAKVDADVDFDASSAFDDLVETQSKDAVDSPESNAKNQPADSEEKIELDVDVPTQKVDDVTWQEVATKLDLAGAYVEIGDADGAKELLNEIVKKGDADQVRKAKALLATLN